MYSTSAVSDGLVYFGIESGHFYALDAATGEERWSFKAKDAAWGSPAVVDGVVYFTARDGNLYALDAGTGEERWRFELFDQEQSRRWKDGSWFSPSVHDTTVYAGSLDGHLYAVATATGEERWRFETRNPVWGTPAVADGAVYFGGGMHWYALDADTGTEKWRFKTIYSVKSSAAVIDNTVILTSGYEDLYALDARTGQERWRTQVAKRHHTPPVIARDRSLVYLVGSDGANIQAYAVDVDSGTIWWQTEVEDGGDFVTISDGRLYTAGHGFLVALE